METIKKSSLYFCVIFSITTLVSSILQLYMGQITDTNLHIIDRGIIILIAIITITLFDKIKIKNKIISFLISYSISMSIVLIYVWISGFWEELHPNAYRDMFLNFTVVSIVVFTVIIIKDYINEKKKADSRST